MDEITTRSPARAGMKAAIIVRLHDRLKRDSEFSEPGYNDSRRHRVRAELLREIIAEIESLEDAYHGLRIERDALKRDNAYLGYVVHGPLLPPQEARATKLERDMLRADNEQLRAPCGELIALYNNGLIVSDGTVSKVIEEIRVALIANENPDG